ncbi:hypothetical protein HID58_094061 [Brassica napus]|uniref:Uncharacterized protein n=1 Tax=Brassica napus TaxID=3708 RepID=A0ABQ7XAL8_BRANA|nr:hypothetical protein HID58_094061 [Brassica napus]
MEQIRGAYPNYTEDQLSALKENEFVNWLKFYVSDNEVFSDSESEKENSTKTRFLQNIHLIRIN